MNVNSRGELKIKRKIHGKNQVYQEIVRMMTQHAQNGTDYSGKCFISNSACLEDARKVADLIKGTFSKLDGEVLINSIGTGIGSHTGPGTVALFIRGIRGRNTEYSICTGLLRLRYESQSTQ
jgi:fatty acid-binding protein DegV